LCASADEAQALVSDLLISVTTFFRDPEVFELLKASIVPQLFKKDEPNAPLRVWVPGGATGEEAYTIGILLLEERAGTHFARPFKCSAPISILMRLPLLGKHDTRFPSRQT
jgi:two-component system, chemotaxis family, CheB/CheR fusion protein